VSTARILLAERTSKHEFELLKRFLRRPYFSRRWIIQEILLAAKLVIYCGDAVIDGNSFSSSISYLLGLPNKTWAGIDVAESFSL
jgi:hypothetical protein